MGDEEVVEWCMCNVQENGGDLTSKWDYVQSEVNKVHQFYSAMCVLYVLYRIAWMVMLTANWWDLLRIQFWIGTLILLGLLEKFGEYQSINCHKCRERAQWSQW